MAAKHGCFHSVSKEQVKAVAVLRQDEALPLLTPSISLLPSLTLTLSLGHTALLQLREEAQEELQQVLGHNTAELELLNIGLRGRGNMQL